jgi:hypothetical protein
MAAFGLVPAGLAIDGIDVAIGKNEFANAPDWFQIFF